MRLLILPKALKKLHKLPIKVQEAIKRKIDPLSSNPFPIGYKKLTNQPGFRIRMGDYRILYFVDAVGGKIIVARIGHRKNIYEKL